MTPSTDDQAFWDLVDEFINNANTACENLDPSLVSAALLQATARFNAFVVAASSLDRKEFIEEIDPAISYLGGRYREHLRDHLQDYRENYKVYIRANEPEDID
ncbi:MAG TPA: DUF3144 domain-containing protein [Cellvibrionaceae bacterium]